MSQYTRDDETVGMTCDCCGGSLPDYDTWEANRDRAGECTGSIDPRTSRCRAYADDALWTISETGEGD